MRDMVRKNIGESSQLVHLSLLLIEFREQRYTKYEHILPYLLALPIGPISG